MTSIAFIYRLHNQSKAFYGKIHLRSISDEHNGLDNVVRNVLFEGINAYRTTKKLALLAERTTLQVGVLSMLNQHVNHCSEEERTCFDFYATQQDDKMTYYVNGREI
jgi:hypothetical protein